MIEASRIIDDLHIAKEKTALYIYPINTDSLFNFLYGLERCFLISFDESEIRSRFRELVDAGQEAIRKRGWKPLSVKPVLEMRDKGLSEEEIIKEFIEIEIEKWRIWESIQKKKITE